MGRSPRSAALMLLVLALGGAAGRPARAAQGAWLGVQLERGRAGGSRIVDVIEESPGARAGLKIGDELLRLGDQPLSQPELVPTVVRRAGIGATVSLTVLGAGGESRTIQVRLEARPEPGESQRRALLGKPAPDFAPAVLSGEPMPSISSLKGQVVLIDFFATWCGPCMAMLPHIQSLHDRLGKRGLKVIGISSEPPALLSELAAKRGLRYAIASDANEGISRRYRVHALPTMVVIDRKGVVREVSVADPDAADAAIQASLSAR